MSDGLKDWASFIQQHPLIKQLIKKKNPQIDCQQCMSLVDQAVKQAVDKRMVFYICMELLQNVSHHALRVANQATIGEFYFQQDAKDWYILTKNFIKSTEVKPLKEKLDLINSLAENKMALRKLYKEIIKSEAPIGKHAGLGLVDIVRKSKHGLQYQFEEVERGKVLFTVMAAIDKKS
ncbi:MAG: DUF6272 family protein [Flammeovirgaceae bacterium]